MGYMFSLRDWSRAVTGFSISWPALQQPRTWRSPFASKGPLTMLWHEHCVRELVLRHEALRTTFRMVDGALSQVISEEPVYSFTVSDLRGLPEATRLAKSRGAHPRA